MKSGIFTAEFLQNLPADDWEATAQLCGEFSRLHSLKSSVYEDYVEAYAILRAFCKSRHVDASTPAMGPNKQENLEAVVKAFQGVRNKADANLTQRNSRGLLEVKTLEYEEIFAKVSCYEFSDSDFNRIQVLINEMRGLIRESKLITDDHKRRLLRRLEAMQAELHKKQGTLTDSGASSARLESPFGSLERTQNRLPIWFKSWVRS